MKQLIIATRNHGKVEEFKAILQNEGISVLSLNELYEKIDEVEETGITFKENAEIKAKTVASILKKPVIADDSGLVVDALDGRPGIYSARYAGEPTDDVKNYEKVLRELIDVEEAKRTARFIAVLALARPGYETIYFKGICEGNISFKPKGSNGFGYDPIFIPENYHVTMAELTNERKNKISHRSLALQKFKRWLQSNRI